MQLEVKADSKRVQMVPNITNEQRSAAITLLVEPPFDKGRG